MNKNPKVGIVIPSYERIEYLKEAVESAINQTYEDLEIIIIDDNSSDVAIKEYLKKINNPKVKWFINRTNLGTTKNYDAGVRLLTEDVEWCVILDNDDFLDRNFIKEAVGLHFKYPQSKAVHCRQVFMDADKKVICEDGDFASLETAEDYLFSRCMGNRDIRSSSIFFNTEEYKKIGGYPLFLSGMCTDTVFPFSLAFDNILAFSEKALVYIRIHDKAESLTADNMIGKLASIKQMQDYCMDVYKANNNDNPFSNKERIKGYLKRYGMSLTDALLIRMYRETLFTQDRDAAKKSIRGIIRFCRESGLIVPSKFLVLFGFFDYFNLDLNKVGFNKLIRMLEMGRCFLSNKCNNFKKYLNRISFTLFIKKQLKAILNALKGRFVIVDFKYCHSCGCYSLFYWWRYYEHMLRKNVPKWGVSIDYTEQMIKRENKFCANCGSVFRMRAHAQTILKIFKQTRLSGFVPFLRSNPSFVVYEAANCNVFRNGALKGLDNYIVSEFHPEYKFGQNVNGTRNENLEGLTFSDESFDLIITSDVLEHVSDLEKALSEIYRVLKPDGYHIFTIPVDYSVTKTRQRVLVGVDGKLNHLLPPVIHGDDIRDGILVYRDFGTDINKILKRHGLKCREDKYYVNRKHIVSIYIAQKIGKYI